MRPEGIPPLLFRGDSDHQRTRQLREVWRRGALLTNLAAGGVGREIFTANLTELINRHVGPGWSRTHFLSLTSSREAAVRFAVGAAGGTLEALPITAIDWETSILTFDCEKLAGSQFNRLSGHYLCRYAHQAPPTVPGGALANLPNLLAEASAPPTHTVLLIDVVEVLQRALEEGHEYHAALGNAQRDSEWLLLPMDLFTDDRGTEFSAKVDTSWVTIEKFRIVANAVSRPSIGSPTSAP